jgi:hypothetical protein
MGHAHPWWKVEAGNHFPTIDKANLEIFKTLHQGHAAHEVPHA